jgi:hypothetical protein
MKKNFFLSAVLALTCCLFSILVSAQNTYQSYGGLFEQVYDSRGISYSLDDVKVDPTKPNNLGGGGGSCNPGYFFVSYDAGSGFEILADPVHQARRDVLCKVLSNLSRFIIPVNSTNLVRIRIRDFNTMGFTADQADETLAAALPFYAFPQPTSGVGGILDNLVWKTINSGQDAYIDVTNMILSSNLNASSSFFHAQLTVNFRDEDDITSNNNSDPIHFNLNTLGAPTNTEYDLYSILLHEMLHALGFGSNINNTGLSGFTVAPYFSRYDSFLQVPISGGQIVPLLADPTEPCSMYTSLWNTAVPLSLFNPNCSLITEYETDCSSAVQFGGSLNQAIYNPGCYAAGSSLSHMADLCDDELVEDYHHYLMAAAFPAGVIRRFMQPEERTILCDLGYHVNDKFGYLTETAIDNTVSNGNIAFEGGDCGGDQIVGINDGIAPSGGGYTFLTNTTDQINLSGDDLLSNDVIGSTIITSSTGASFECLELIIGSGTIQVNGSASANSGLFNDAISFSASIGGLKVLRYIPVYQGKKGNITYVFIYVSPTPTPPFSTSQFEYQDCAISACNLINNITMEDDAGACSHKLQGDGFALSCWRAVGSTILWPAYFTRSFNYNDDGTLVNCGNAFVNPISNSAPVGIGSNTNTFPPSDSYSGVGNNGFLFLGAHNVVGFSPSINSSKLRTQLSSPIIPGLTYKLSYRAKVFNSGIDPANCTSCLLQYSSLYSTGNVPAYVRFYLGSNFLDFNQNLPVFNTDFTGPAGLSDVRPLSELVSIEPIEAVSEFTAQGDWHLREAIIEIPEDYPVDLQYLYIDYNIWDAGYSQIITGFFIDDISLEVYTDPLVDFPEAICPTTTLNNLASYIVSSGITGTFSCPTCPEGSIGEDGNSFDASVAGEGEHQIVFTYTNIQGCEVSEINTVLVDEAGCCQMSIVVDEIVPNPCPNSEQGKVFITVNNAPSGLQFNWVGPMTSNEEDPSNLAAGTYTLTVTDGGECNETITVVIPQVVATSVPTITSQDDADLYVNGQVLHINGNLNVVASTLATIEFSNCALYFNTNGAFNVQENSNISFNESELDACTPTWKGVVLRSTHDTPTIPGARIKYAEHLQIRHALVGINAVDDNNNANGNFDNLDCGSMVIVNSQFIDNRIALNIVSGRSTSITGQVVLRDCEFQWTPDILNHFPNMWGAVTNTSPVNKLVYLRRYKGASFSNCVFENNATTNNWNVRGYGIQTVDAKIVVKSTAPELSSQFRGFHMGMNLLGVQPYYAGTVVQDNLLEKNLVGIAVLNQSSIRVNRNTIHVGVTTNVNALDNALVKYEGIHLNHSTGFQTSENHIYGYIDGAGKLTDDDTPYTVGITAASTTSSNEEIYKNDFHNLNWANVANGINQPTAGSGGLRYVCNSNTGNNYDFVVADFPNTTGALIGEVQTDFANVGSNEEQRAAGNTFTQGNTNVFNDFWNEAQMNGITYKYYPNPIEVPTQVNSDLVTTLLFFTPNQCFTEMTLFTSPSDELNLATINNWQTHKQSKRSDWMSTRYLWKSLIDGGSTEELQYEIENAYNGTTWAERQKLLNISPYVSHTVLMEVADNITVFPHPVALEIFMANPDVMNDKTFIQYLSQKANPMPQYMIDILMDAGNQTTSRTILEREMSLQKSMYLDAAQKVFNARLADTTFTIEQQMEEMKQWHNLPTEFSIIQHYMASGEYESAVERYDLIPETCDFGKESYFEFESFGEWMNLSRAIVEDSLYMDSLPAAFVEQLENLAYNAPFTYGGTQARIMMNEYYGGDFSFEPFVPLLEAKERSSRVKNYISVEPLMKVFPDPASELVNIQLHLPQWEFKNGGIKITDAQGRLQEQLNIQMFDQQFCINLNSWSAGLYTITLISNDRIIQVNKLQVVK